MKLTRIAFLTITPLSALAFMLTTSCKHELNDTQAYTPYIGEEDSSYLDFPIDLKGKTFNTGGGTGGYFIDFYEDGLFETYGFCDICPGSGTIGRYTQKSNAIYMIDSVCFVNEPHFTDEAKIVDCWNSTMTVYYLVRTKDAIYLSENANDTLDPKQVHIDGWYPKYEIETVENPFTID